MPRPDRVLDNAARRIARQGRAIGRLEDDDGGVCIEGAISQELHGGDAWAGQKGMSQVADLMRKHGVTGGKEAYAFNDSTMSDRKVINAMHEAARRERLAQAEERLTDEMRGWWSTPGESREEELVEVKHDSFRNKDFLGVGTGPG